MSQGELDVEHNGITYTGRQMNGVIKMLEDGNKHTGWPGHANGRFGIAGKRWSIFMCERYEYIHLVYGGQASSSLPRDGT